MGSNKGRFVKKWIQRSFFITILAWLIWQLSDIGWVEVIDSLPLNLWFYILFFLIYFSLPLSEIIIYKLSWSFRFKEVFWPMMIKKIYNKDVIGYSGEVYFYLWAKKHLHLSHAQSFSTIKDNNIISSVASTIFSLALLAVFALSGQIRFLDIIPFSDYIYLVGGILLSISVVVLLIYFRKYIFGMTMDIASKIFAIHVVRLSLGLIFQILQWAIIMPEVPMYVWITFISIQIIMSRIPFLPNQDLLFLGLSLPLSGMLEVSMAGIAGLMVANAILGKVMNLAFFSFAGIVRDVDLEKEAITVTKKETEPEQTDSNF